MRKAKKNRPNKTTNHFHPRGLARAVAHHMMEWEGATGVNKVHPGATRSAFAKNWRNIAERVAD